MADDVNRLRVNAPSIGGGGGIDPALECAYALLAAEIGLAIDVRKLKPSELIRLVNSTPLGEAITSRKLARFRDRAGLRIGDDRSIDLLRFAAWLALERRRGDDATGLAGYEAQRERSRQRQADMSRSGRDIGELPDVVNHERRAAAGASFRVFCESYFPQTFHLKWSNDHLRALHLVETVVMDGGQFAFAMPRGSGKTSLCESACLWAQLYGYHAFVAIIGPDQGHAEQRVENMTLELQTSDLLLEDFPEVCYPIRRLEGITQRRLLYRGELVRMEFTATRIILPVIPGARAAGAITVTAGLTGQIRGLSVKRADGSVVRPTLVLCDDPQTDESAHSPSQCSQRERIINGAILGLAGPGRKISALMPCTVVRPNDLAERALDRKRNPQWQGERTKLVYTWAGREDLWQAYVQVRRRALEEHAGDRKAIAEACNSFYARQRAVMDAGAVVAWPERHYADELSALQHAWNIRCDRGDEAFFAEYQNEPLAEQLAGGEEQLTADHVAARLNGHQRGQAPAGTVRLTAFVDVQQKALFYVVCAWEEDFTGHVIDYGTEPDQKSQHFSLREIRYTLAVASPRAGIEGAIYAGLERFAQRVLAVDWPVEGGGALRVERCLVDANWGASTKTVYRFCRQSTHAAVLTPSHGKYVGASSVPVDEWQRKPGERIGAGWRLGIGADRSRRVVFDTNLWKSFVQARLTTALGDPGALALYGRQPERHRLIAEHLTSEYSVRTEGRGRTVDEWKLRAVGRDNHWLDCLVGCAVAASMQGVALAGEKSPVRERVSFSEMQRRARA